MVELSQREGSYSVERERSKHTKTFLQIRAEFWPLQVEEEQERSSNRKKNYVVLVKDKQKLVFMSCKHKPKW